MVNGRYIGRGDSAKIYLGDAEVLRLHERRRQLDVDALALLDKQFARDPVPRDQRTQAHLFLLAEPLTPRSEMFLHKLHHQGLLSVVSEGAYADEEVNRALGRGTEFVPELSSASEFSRRSAGAALSTLSLRSDRTVDPSSSYRPEDIVELEVSEDGAVRIMMGRLSYTGTSGAVLFDIAAVIYVRRLIGLLRKISEASGYLGGWALAVGAIGLSGLASADIRPYQAQHFENDTYARATAASYADLGSRPGTVADQLVGRFLRKLGTHARYAKHLSNPPAEDSDD